MQLPTLSPRRLAGVAAIACAPNGRTAYAVNSGSGTVTPISTATNKPGKPIKVGKDPFALAITPNGRVVEVASQASGTVAPIFTAVNRAGKSITGGSTPW